MLPLGSVKSSAVALLLIVGSCRMSKRIKGVVVASVCHAQVASSAGSLVVMAMRQGGAYLLPWPLVPLPPCQLALRHSLVEQSVAIPRSLRWGMT